MSARFAAVVFFVLLIPFVLAGCFIPTDRDLAVKLEDALRKQLHPESVKVVVYRRSLFSTTVRKLDITLTGFTTNSMPLMGEETAVAGTSSKPSAVLGLAPPASKAKVRRIRIVNATIHCYNFHVKHLPVQTMEIKLHEVRVPLKDNPYIESAESANGSMTFTAQGLTEFLNSRKRLPIDNPQVRFTTDGCVLSGKVRAFFNTPVELSGRILAKNEAVLYLDQPKIRVSSLTLPGGIAEQLLKELNPLADLNTDFHFPVPVTVTKTTHGDGVLKFDATLHFPQAGRK